MVDMHPDARDLLERWRAAPDVWQFSASEARERRRQMDDPDSDREPVGEVHDEVVHREGHGIPVRVYVPEGEGPFPVLVWAHGGGFIFGHVDDEDSTARALTNASECVVVSVEYRLAPEHPFPAGLRDVYAATEWAVDDANRFGGDPDRLVVGGASAGGTLAAGTTMLARDEDGPDVDYQVLVYPVMTFVPEFPSRTEYDGYVIAEEGFDWIRESYFHDPIHRHNPYASPLAACDHAGLPPTTVVTAGFDPLQDEAGAYVDALEAAGVPVEHRHVPDMVHGFFGQPWDRSRDTVAAVGSDVGAHFD